ncbi:MAG: hypothetical protein IH598_12880 [Bacteroidales bacterium]|nr:hypothetical protein [Bacteroidales bacterium]
MKMFNALIIRLTLMCFLIGGVFIVSNAQEIFYNHLNKSNLYIRNQDGTISDSSISINENYLRQWISTFRIKFAGKSLQLNEAETPINEWFNELLFNPLPTEDDNNSRFNFFNQTDIIFKQVIDSINSLTRNSETWSNEKIQNLIYLNRQLNDIEKKTESYIHMQERCLETKAYYDTLLIGFVAELFSIDQYVQDLMKMTEDNTWLTIQHQQVSPYGEFLTADESDTEPMKYIRCCKRIGDVSLKKGGRVAALVMYYQAYTIAFFNNELLELGICETKIAKVFESGVSASYSKHAIRHKATADSLFYHVGYMQEENSNLKILESARIRVLSLHSKDRTYLDCANINTLVDFFSEVVGQDLSYEENFNLYSAIGIYFGQTNFPGDYEIAKKYFQAALIFAMNDLFTYDFNQVDKALSWLSWINSVIGDTNNCIKYSDWEFSLAKKHHFEGSYAAYWFIRANYIMNCNDYQKAKEYLKNGFDFANSKNLLEGYVATLGYETAVNCYTKLYEQQRKIKYKETADYYSILLKTQQLKSLDEINQMVEIDNNFINFFIDLNSKRDFYSMKAEYDYQLDSFESEIKTKEAISKKLESEIVNNKNLLNAQNLHLDTLKSQMINDSLMKLSLMGDNNSLKNDIANLTNDIAWSSNVLKKLNKDKDNAINQKEIAEEVTSQTKKIANGIVILSIVVSIIFLYFIRRQHYKNINKKNAEMIKANSRAAISQLFARTDSHDLGHVLDAYKSFKDFNVEEADGQYRFVANSNLQKEDKLLHQEGKELLEKFTYISPSNNKFSLYPNLMGYFNLYLRTRMDFRADVATTDPNSLTTLDFYQDVFMPFNNNLIFNNRISGISDINLHYRFEILRNNIVIKNKEKVPVAIPNDILGCQAMYIIWSNVIRNTVKHGELDENEKESLVFSVNICENNDNADYYELSVFPNVFRNKDFVDDLVLKRNISFDADIWNNEEGQEGRLRDNSLGTIEMATCAAYLRKLAVTEVDNPKYKLFDKGSYQNGSSFKEDSGSFTPMIMYAYAQPQSEDGLQINQYSLGYKFYLHKPKEILVVCDQPEALSSTLISNSDKLVLSKNGIKFIKPERLVEETFNHKFLAFYGSKDDFNKFKDSITKLNSSLPKRLVHIDQTNTFENINNFTKACWREWLQQYNKSVNIFSCSRNEEIFIYPENTIDNADFNVHLFNHHEGLYGSTDDETIKKLEDGNYHEMMCGHHWTKKHLGAYLTHDRFKTSINAEQYIESVFTNVIIIDERIQKSIVVNKKKYAGKIPFTTYFNQLGVFIPSKLEDGDPDLNKTNLMEEKGKIKSYIERHIDKSSFVVIHLGILEKLLVDKKDKSDTAIDNILEEIIGKTKKNRGKIVITSGRGKANNVKQDISYVPISLMQNAIETTFDKYRLIQILFNCRKSL